MAPGEEGVREREVRVQGPADDEGVAAQRMVEGAPSAGVIWRRRGGVSTEASRSVPGMARYSQRLKPFERAPLSNYLLEIGDLLRHIFGELDQPILSLGRFFRRARISSGVVGISLSRLRRSGFFEVIEAIRMLCSIKVIPDLNAVDSRQSQEEPDIRHVWSARAGSFIAVIFNAARCSGLGTLI